MPSQSNIDKADYRHQLLTNSIPKLIDIIEYDMESGERLWKRIEKNKAQLIKFRKKIRSIERKFLPYLEPNKQPAPFNSLNTDNEPQDRSKLFR